MAAGCEISIADLPAAGICTLTSPQPERRAAPVHRIAAPRYSALPAITSACPCVPLWSNSPRGRSSVGTYAASTATYADSRESMNFLSRPMCTVRSLPAYRPVSGSSSESFGNSMVNVRSAAITSAPAASSRLQGSVGRPEGMSIEITMRQRRECSLTSLIACSAAPRTAPVTPVPSIASMTTVFLRNSCSGGNSLPSAVMRLQSRPKRLIPAGSRFKLSQQSGESWSGAASRITEMLRVSPKRPLSSLATASPSPPLLPFPAIIRYSGASAAVFWSSVVSAAAAISASSASAALSINSTLATGSCSIVYRSASRMSFPVSIFMVQTYKKLRLYGISGSFFLFLWQTS